MGICDGEKENVSWFVIAFDFKADLKNKKKSF